jgi:hypothetical protein
VDDRLIGSLLRAAYPEVGSDDPVAFYSEVGDVIEALKYARLYAPKVVEFYGAVFLLLLSKEEVDIPKALVTPLADGHPDWPEMSWAEAVNSYNIFEIPHLFRSSGARTGRSDNDNAWCALGKILADSWRALLAERNPDRRFLVRLVDADDSMDLRIEVIQEWPALKAPGGWDSKRRGIMFG